jgi:hypothetical protein
MRKSQADLRARAIEHRWFSSGEFCRRSKAAGGGAERRKGRDGGWRSVDIGEDDTLDFGSAFSSMAMRFAARPGVRNATTVAKRLTATARQAGSSTVAARNLIFFSPFLQILNTNSKISKK